MKSLLFFHETFVMHVFALFTSFVLATNGSLFLLPDWSPPSDFILDPLQQTLDVDLAEDSSSPESHIGKGAFSDDLEDPKLEQAISDLNDHGGDAGSLYFAGTINTNDNCRPDDDDDDLQPLRKKTRAESSCPTDPGGEAREENTGNRMPKTDFFPLEGSTPWVDFNSIDRNIGYCPAFFYDILLIPVCASADEAYIKKNHLGYYNLDHAMRGMIISYPLPLFFPLIILTWAIFSRTDPVIEGGLMILT